MAMRRPRIKAAANLVNIKRKKLEVETSTTKSEQNVTKDNFIETEKRVPENICTDSNENKESSLEDTNLVTVHAAESKNIALSSQETPAAEQQVQENLLGIEDAIVLQQNAHENTFKEPFKVESRLCSSSTNFNSITSQSDEILNNDLEGNVIQTDLSSTHNGFPMSPNKQQNMRAKMRPPPFMGQRRNSYVGCSPSTQTFEDNSEFILPSPRRERYHSSSSAGISNLGCASPAYTPNKNTSLNIQARARRESVCSNSSEFITATTNSTNFTTAAKARRQPNSDYLVRLQWKRDYESRCGSGIPDKARLKMLDLLFYNPTNNPMEIKLQKNTTSVHVEEEKDAESSLKEDNSKNKNLVVPQLKLNANNELVLDDTSLVIETTAEQEARKMLANTSLVFVDENTGMNGFYKKQKRTREWPHDETVKFYRCLQTIGTDFSLMQQLFPKRTRRELKLKFKKEERVNGLLINKALLHPKTFNVSELKNQLEAEDQKREEENEKWKELQKKNAFKPKKENKETRSAASRALSGGTIVYENEHVLQKKVGNRTIIADNNYLMDDNSKSYVTQDTKDVLKAHVEKTMASRILKSSTKDIEEGPPKIVRKGKKAESEKTKTLRKKVAKKLNEEELNNPLDTSADEVENEQLEKQIAQLLDTVPDSSIEKKTNNLENEVVVIDKLETPTAFDNELIDNILLANLEESGSKTLMDMDNGKSFEVFEAEEDYVIQTTDFTTNIPVNMNSSDNSSAKDATDIIIPTLDIKQDQHENTVLEILKQIEDGGLMLVSSIDPENTDNVINEIYMIDKSTGELCDKPLDLPEEILQAIIDLVA